MAHVARSDDSVRMGEIEIITRVKTFLADTRTCYPDTNAKHAFLIRIDKRCIEMLLLHGASTFIVAWTRASRLRLTSDQCCSAL